MRKSYIILLLAVLAMTAGIIIGVVMSQQDKTSNLQQEPKTTLAEEVNNQQNGMEAVTTSHIEVKTTPNTLYVFQTYYKECGHTIWQREKIPEEEINKTEEDLQEKYRDWGIKEFTAEQILFYQEQEGICNEHYMLRDTNGYLTIYTINASGQEILKEITDIITNYLPETDKQQLQEGIQVNGQENLNAAIEDYE